MASQKYLPNLTKTKDRLIKIKFIKESIGTDKFSELFDFSLSITYIFCRASEKFPNLKDLLEELNSSPEP